MTGNLCQPLIHIYSALYGATRPWEQRDEHLIVPPMFYKIKYTTAVQEIEIQGLSMSTDHTRSVTIKRTDHNRYMDTEKADDHIVK